MGFLKRVYIFRHTSTDQLLLHLAKSAIHFENAECKSIKPVQCHYLGTRVTV